MSVSFYTLIEDGQLQRPYNTRQSNQDEMEEVYSELLASPLSTSFRSLK